METNYVEPILADLGPHEHAIVTFTERAKALVVSDAQSHHYGQELLRDLAHIERGITELFAEPKAAAHRAHRAVCAAEKKLLDEVQTPRRQIGALLSSYELEEGRKAEAKRRELQAAAQKAAQDQLLADAVAVAEAGDPVAAEEMLQDAESVDAPVVYVEPELSKVDGVSSRTLWSAEVTDMRRFVQFVALNPTYMNMLKPDMKALNAMARSLRENMHMPGIRVSTNTVHAVRKD